MLCIVHLYTIRTGQTKNSIENQKQRYKQISVQIFQAWCLTALIHLVPCALISSNSNNVAVSVRIVSFRTMDDCLQCILVCMVWTEKPYAWKLHWPNSTPIISGYSDFYLIINVNKNRRNWIKPDAIAKSVNFDSLETSKITRPASWPRVYWVSPSNRKSSFSLAIN